MRHRLLLIPSIAVVALMAGVAVGAPDGKALYTTKCVMCHGTDGVAKSMWANTGVHNFNDAAWQKSKTDADLTKTISEGSADKKMPSYKDKMTAEEIAAVVKHIRTLTAPAK